MLNLKIFPVLCFTLLFSSFSVNAAGWLQYQSFASLKLGYASMGTDNNTSVPETSHYTYGAEFSLGLNLLEFLHFGVATEYTGFSQITDLKDTSGVNSSGKLFSLSPYIGLQYRNYFLIVKTPSLWNEAYNFDKKNSDDEEVKYISADNLSIQMLYQTKLSGLRLFYGLEYRKVSFYEVDRGVTTLGLADDQVLHISSYTGLVGLTF